MEVRKKEEDTPSTKGKYLFSLLLHPSSSMDSTTKAQSLQNKASVPSFYQGRLHKNHYENQAIVPLPTQHLAHSYTASLSVVKVNTIPLIASYKTKILIFLAGKPQKKGKKGTPKATCFLSMDTNSQKSIFLSDTDCRIEDIYKKKGIYAQDFTKY